MYLLHGKLTAKAGLAGQLSPILLEAADLVSTAPGCRLYVVSQDPNEATAVFVTEIWDSKQAHDASLGIPAVRELITKALPLLDGPPVKGQELDLLGGFGIVHS